MKTILRKSCSYLFPMATIIFSMLYFWLLIFHVNDFIDTNTLLLLIAGIFGFSIISMYMKYTNFSIKTHRRQIWFFLFVVYLSFLCYLLFLSKDFLRGITVFSGFDEYMLYLKSTWLYGINLVPFSSILHTFSLSSTPGFTSYIITNIFGNLIAFMPFAFFLKLLFQNIKWYQFLFIISIVVSSVEFLQFFSATGALDVDDFILNVGGAMLCYAVLHLPIFQKHDKLL